MCTVHLARWAAIMSAQAGVAWRRRIQCCLTATPCTSVAFPDIVTPGGTRNRASTLLMFVHAFVAVTVERCQQVVALMLSQNLNERAMHTGQHRVDALLRDSWRADGPQHQLYVWQ